MLPLPTSGMIRSTEKHNCDKQRFCDWLEASLLFKNEKRISRADVVDILLENSIYDDQDFANSWMETVWTELRRRESILGHACPYQVCSLSVKRVKSWREVPSYSFCVLAALLPKAWLPRYSDKKLARHYAVQGKLFERISELSLKGLGWSTHRTAWSSDAALSLPSVVESVSKTIGHDTAPNWRNDVSPRANELGLDVIFYRKFSDKRVGFPLFFAQCATGNDWGTKLHTPPIAQWIKIINLPFPPTKAFLLPHSLDDLEHRQVTVKAEGVVLDRYRIHDGSLPSNWCSELSDEIIKFIAPLVSKLPDVN